MIAENKQKENKKRSIAYFFLIFSSVFLYVILVLSRNIYIAEKTTLFSLGTFGNLTELASVNQYFFWTYAIMQVLLVFFVDKVNTKWFFSVTLTLSGILTVYVAFTNTIIEHYVIFAIMGLLQAGIWGGLIKILSQYLPARLLPVANQYLTMGTAAGSAFAYGVAAAFGNNWRAPFLLVGILVIFGVVLYFASITIVAKYPRDIEMHHVVYADGSEADVSDEEGNDFIHLNSKGRVIGFFVMSILLSVFLTASYFMLSNNLDIYLKEIGNCSNETAKLLTILAPLAAMIGPLVVVRICEKIKNFFVVGALFFSVAFTIAVLLYFVFNMSVLFSLILFALYLMLTNGGRTVLLSIAAFRMRAKLNVGVYTMAVNSVASIVAGFAPKLVTVFLDNESLGIINSWSASFLMTIAVNAVAIIGFIAIITILRFINRKKKDA